MSDKERFDAITDQATIIAIERYVTEREGRILASKDCGRYYSTIAEIDARFADSVTSAIKANKLTKY